MSPTHDFNNIGDVLDFELLKGTIKSIDSATDTCTVDVGGTTLTALIFYHCDPDSVMRESGAIEGAAAGFSEDDEVVVLKKYDDSVVKVIAHTDGIRHCKSLSIYFGGQGTSAGTGKDCWCFVWDIKNDGYKEDVPLNRGDDETPVTFASFPCKMSEISQWLSEQSSPDIYGDILQSTSVIGSLEPPAIHLTFYTNDSDSVSVPALIGSGVNTATGTWSRSGSDVQTPYIGEEWHWSDIYTYSYSVTDAYGANGTNHAWPPAWSRKYLISEYFDNGGAYADFLTSVEEQTNLSTTTAGYRGYYDHSGDYSDYLQTSSGSATLSWTDPFGNSFDCSMSSTYSLHQSMGSEETKSGYADSIRPRIANGGYYDYFTYELKSSIYTKTLLFYVNISMFKVMRQDRVDYSFTETPYRHVFAGFKKCEDTKGESPLDIDRNSELETAIADVIAKQAAEIDMTGIPTVAGIQLTDRYWSAYIFGGKNN